MSYLDRPRHYLLNLGYTPERVYELMEISLVEARAIKTGGGIAKKKKYPKTVSSMDSRLKEAIHMVLSGESREAAAKKCKVELSEVIAGMHNAQLEIKRLANVPG